MLTVLAALLALPPSYAAAAEAPPLGKSSSTDTKASAAVDHFRKGSYFSSQKKFVEAAAEFRQAYEATKDAGQEQAVLLALAFAYVGANSLPQAVDCYAQYLRVARTLPSTQRDTKKEEQVEAILNQYKADAAFLRVNAEPHDAKATVTVDGFRMPANERLMLGIGTRTVAVSAPGYVTQNPLVVLVSQGYQSIEVQLQPIASPPPPPPPPPPPQQGPLVVDCDVPEISAWMDNGPLALTARELLVPTGPHTFTFKRDGYRPHSTRANIEARPTHVDCGLTPLSPLPAAVAARLTVRTTEPDAEIRLDGRPFRSSTEIPSGKHRLDVSRPGFVPYSVVIMVHPGELKTVQVPLAPTPEYARDRWAHATHLRTLAYVAAGTGVALGGVGLGLFLDNNSRYHRWENTQSAIDKDWLRFSGTPQAAGVQARQDDNDAYIDDVLARDRAALGLGVGGGVLLAGGILLYAFGEDPERYKHFLFGVTASGWTAGFDHVW